MKQFKYILFSFDGACAPIAKKLIDEGRECFYVQVQSYKDMPKDSFMGKPEDKEMEKRRLEIFDGIIDKYTDDEILKWMPTIPDKENYFIYFDFNTFYEYSEKILEMGFVNGYFPLKEDYELEHDRQSGKEFAKKYIKGVKVAEVQEFNKIDDGIQFLNDNTDKIYALKSNGNNCKTIVPLTNNPEFAKNELIIELNRSKKEWEKGFTLEEKIVDITEVCPQICFYNGIPIYTEIEMETRLLGAGDIGCQTGGNQNMVMRTNFYDKINKLAFPKEVYT
jgi:hypothetical protein